ncbi:MAG TPA: glycoside hydrolase family 3 N-terminal domain-containing protein [Solirubrobacterales bacterium]|nr:glycoside hydrolase family 3 N-terminal domain-containing protein [Solirubrobacterales bacterium]
MIALIAALFALAGSSPSSPAAEDPVRELSNTQLAGQRIVTGFTGHSPPAALESMIRKGQVAGVVLFTRNFDSASEARSLIDRLRDIRRPRGLRQPLLISVDQEGGLVKRLPGPPTMSGAEMGAAGGDAAARQGQRTGRYLRGLGFNVNLAPVLDLAVPGGNIAATSRGFSGSASGVIDTALPFGRALERQGVAATAKHFPGFGRARQNTDYASQTIDVGRTTLRDQDERPFAAFSREEGDLVMLANAVYPALDPRRPASLSRAIASHELRRVAGFGGVSITDSLDAAGITSIGSPERVAVMGVRAGADVLLFSSLASAYRAHEALATDLSKGKLDRERFRTSVERVLALRASLRG